MTPLTNNYTYTFYFVLFVQATVNAATFLSIPLLALYLTKHLNYTPTTMGAVLTTLLISTRATPLITGALADRYGYKRFVITGLLIRSLGLLLIGYKSETLSFRAASLIGLGGSFYESGTYGYLARTSTTRKDTFYLNNQALNLGVIIGPSAAFFIPLQGYGAFFLSSAVIFLLLAAVNIFVFPSDETRAHIKPYLSLRSLLTDCYTDKRLLFFNLICIPWWFLFSQLYVLLPLTFSQKITREGDELVLYLINGIVGISLTLLFLRNIKNASPLRLMLAGHALLSAAYLIPLTNNSAELFLLMVFIFSIAETFIMPAIDTYIAKIAPPGREANYFGTSNIPWIIGACAGNLAGAQLFILADAATPWIIMSILATTGLVAVHLFSIASNRHPI